MTTDADRIDALLAETAPPGSDQQWPHLKLYETKYIIGPIPPRVLANAPVGTWSIYQVKEGVGAAAATLHIAAMCNRSTNKLATKAINAAKRGAEPARTFIRATVVARTKS